MDLAPWEFVKIGDSVEDDGDYEIAAYICNDCMWIQRESEKCKSCGGKVYDLDYEDVTDEEDCEQ